MTPLDWPAPKTVPQNQKLRLSYTQPEL